MGSAVSSTHSRIESNVSARLLPTRVKMKGQAKQLTLLKQIKTSHVISSVKIDEYKQVVYIGTADDTKLVQIYSLAGKHLGRLPPAGIVRHACLAMDTKRGLMLVITGHTIVLYGREGSQTRTIKCPEFKHLQDIAYQAQHDRYVVGDLKAHCLYYIDPDTYNVVLTVPAEEARLAKDGGRNFFMAANGATYNTTLATLDHEKSLEKLYDGDGSLIQSYGGTGSGLGQLDHPEGICVDQHGRVVVSDMDNQRLVRVSPDVVEQNSEWQVVGDTSHLGLGHPRMVDITEDGTTAVAFFTTRKGPFHLTILSGPD